MGAGGGRGKGNGIQEEGSFQDTAQGAMLPFI